MAGVSAHLLVERISSRHLKEILVDAVLGATTATAGVLVRVESYAEAEDWERELTGTQLLRVSELLHTTDGSDDASTPRDKVVRVVTEGSAVRAMGGVVKSLITTRLEGRQARFELQADLSVLAERRRARRADFTVQDEAEYHRLSEVLAENQRPGSVDDALQETLSSLVPVDRDGLNHKRFDVALGEGGGDRGERTFVVESNAVPQFVYPLGGLLPDAALRELWQQHAAGILKNLGVTLPRGWADA